MLDEKSNSNDLEAGTILGSRRKRRKSLAKTIKDGMDTKIAN